MGTCPYLSEALFDDAGELIKVQKVECIETECQLWDSIGNKCSTQGGPTNSVTPSTLLMMEFQGNQDIDNNGKIYGKDFKITDSSEKPSTLQSIENSPYWEEPYVSIPWSEYLDWFENPIDVSNPLSSTTGH